jgi:NADPH-dependent 2,4-dienoyl-CoA reductase/sulfur reductase-like enzyme
MAERIIIIGGDAAGMAAVSQIRKGAPDAQIIALEKGTQTSYAACGIPFLVGGEVEGGIEQLVARSPEQHRKAGLDLRTRHEATAIDTTARTVEVHDLDADRRFTLEFDQLLIGTGGKPIRPPFPGIDLPFVHGVHGLDTGARLLEAVEDESIQNIVIVGAGYIGIEMAEAFLHRGRAPIVVEMASQPLTLLDPEMGALIGDTMTSHGLDLRTETAVEGFEPGVVHTSGGPIPADLVVLGIGIGPNSQLAAEAGLDLGVRNAIAVDDRMQTSVEGIWAAGDCVESTHLVTEQKVHIALGTYANKQARVAGINIGGGDARMPGVLGTAITKACDTEIALTGINSAQAAAAGFDVLTHTITSPTRAHYYPGVSDMTVRLIVDRPTGRLLGAQIVGGGDSAKRIDTCVAAITAGMTIEQILDLDLAYAPPFSPVWDPVAVAARETMKRR